MQSVFKHRILLASALLLFALYAGWFRAFAVPNFSAELQWTVEDGLIVKPHASAQYSQLEPLSRVISIDGVMAQRGQQLFPYTQQSAYELELIDEAGNVKSVLVKDQAFPTARILDLSYQFIVTFLFLLSGFGIVAFASKSQKPNVAMLAGFIFQLLGILTIGRALVAFGGVGAWLINGIWFILPTIPIVLVLVLMRKGVNRYVIQAIVIIASALFITSLIEYKFLFPSRDWSDIVGVSSASIVDLLFLCGLVIALIMALRMSVRAESQLTRYDSRLLLITLVILLLPVCITVFFEAVVGDAAKFVSADPIIFTYLLLIPLLYTYLFFRHSFRLISKAFARILAACLLGTMVVALIYTFGFLMAVSNIVSSPTIQYSSVGVAVIIGLALLPVTTSIASVLVYGSHRSIEKATADSFYRLGSEPTKENMSYVLTDISSLFGCDRAAISVKPVGISKALLIEDSEALDVACLQMEEALPGWVFQDVPLAVNGDLSMKLLLSAPFHGSFSQRQQYDLKALSATLGASVQLVLHHLNQQERLEQAVLEREVWRRQIRTEIHNGPVQNMTLLVRKLNKKLDSNSVQHVQSMAKDITADLRSLCSRLQPFSSNATPEWIVREQVRAFQENHSGIAVSLILDVEEAPRPPDIVCLALRFILEESLANIAKHADSDMVRIEAAHNLGGLSLKVTDNGNGFQRSYQAPFGHSSGQGMLDMKYWASLTRGVFSIKPLAENQGVQVSVIFKAEDFIHLPQLQHHQASEPIGNYAYSSV